MNPYKPPLTTLGPESLGPSYCIYSGVILHSCEPERVISVVDLGTWFSGAMSDLEGQKQKYA
jgi:hypothetical protein